MKILHAVNFRNGLVLMHFTGLLRHLHSSSDNRLQKSYPSVAKVKWRKNSLISPRAFHFQSTSYARLTNFGKNLLSVPNRPCACFRCRDILPRVKKSYYVILLPNQSTRFGHFALNLRYFYQIVSTNLSLLNSSKCDSNKERHSELPSAFSFKHILHFNEPCFDSLRSISPQRFVITLPLS